MTQEKEYTTIRSRIVRHESGEERHLMERKGLIEARIAVGLSQEKVAEHIGVARSTISQWERGMQTPHPFYIHKLCQFFNKRAEELEIIGKATLTKEEERVQGEQPSLTSKEETIHVSQLATLISQGIVLAARELSKEEMPILPTTDSRRTQRKAFLDILAYKRNIRMGLHLHRTSTAQGLLGDVNADIQDLEQLEQQARGHDLYYVKELLIGNHLLAAKIVKDQRQYACAHAFADNAVRVAKSLEDGDLIAATKYFRGCVNFEWAQFGTVKQGILKLNEEKVRDAIYDFRDVLDIAHLQRIPLHPQLRGFTCLQIGRAYSLLHGTLDGSAKVHPLTFIDQAESVVGCDSIEDAYTRLIITGTVSGLHWGAYYLNKAETLIALGMQDQALPELKRLRQLTERTYAQDETRNQAWSNIVMAEVLMGLEAYSEVTNILRNALLACHSINSAQIAATIIDIHSRLAISSYRTSADVREIGAILKEWYGVA